MKINVRHESAQEVAEETQSHPARTCVWIVGDDGETQDTAYLEPGQALPIEIEIDAVVDAYTFGPVGPIEVPVAAEEAQAAEGGEGTPIT